MTHAQHVGFSITVKNLKIEIRDQRNSRETRKLYQFIYWLIRYLVVFYLNKYRPRDNSI